jgi:hypothetical protein
VEIVYDQIKKMFEVVEETRDSYDDTKFAPTRINIVFRIPLEHLKEFNDHISEPRIDSTFEMQLRTIMSEGWHEVEHDMRYKCKSDWDTHKDMSRLFNGILASLETSEWGILKVLEEVSYRHYKDGNIEGLIRSKFRLRLVTNSLSKNIKEAMDLEFQRATIKILRSELVSSFIDEGILLPLSMDNLVLYINHKTIKRQSLYDMTPELILKQFQ